MDNAKGLICKVPVILLLFLSISISFPQDNAINLIDSSDIKLLVLKNIRDAQYPKALQLVQMLLIQEPENYDATALYIKLLILNGQYEKAQSRWNELPEDYKNCYGLAGQVQSLQFIAEANKAFGSYTVTKEQKELEAALKNFKSAAACDQENITIKKQLGLLFFNYKYDYPAAKNYLLAFTQKKQDDAEVNQALAAACLYTGDYLPASRLYKNILDAAPGNASHNMQLYYNLGKAYCYSGDLINATKTYEEILKLDPGNTPARAGLIEVAICAGNFAEAFGQCKALLAQQPDYLPLQIMLGYLYQSQWDIKAARRSFAAVLAADKNNYEAAQALKELRYMHNPAVSSDNYYHSNSFGNEIIKTRNLVKLALFDNTYLKPVYTFQLLRQRNQPEVTSHEAGFEADIFWGNALKLTTGAAVYKYNVQSDYQFNGSGLVNINSSNRLNIYLFGAYRLPVADSIQAVQNNLYYHDYGLCINAGIIRQLDGQVNIKQSHYSDSNFSKDLALQLTYTCFADESLKLRLKYWYLDFLKTSNTYWTPRQRQEIQWGIDLSRDFFGRFKVKGRLEVPYIINENKFRYDFALGFNFNTGDSVFVNGEYKQSFIPAAPADYFGNSFTLGISYFF